MSQNTKWTTKNIPDQSGKIVVVTGANSGLGYETSKALANKGAKVIMACRTVEKGHQAAEEIRKTNPTANLNVKNLDLADLASVRSFVEIFRSSYQKLDILINNAGVMAIPRRLTKDGFEMQFGTNHLGHYALTGLLINLLQTTPDSRVVTVSSYAHYLGRMNFNDLMGEKSYQKWLAYGQSKLSNLLFAYELQRKLSLNGGNPISVTAHPGYAATNLQRSSSFFSFLNSFMAQSQEMGALPVLYAAISETIKGGEYVGPDGFLGQRGYPKVYGSSKASYNQENAVRLWEVSSELTGVNFPF